MNFENYIAAYNSGDPDALAPFYTEDVITDGPDGRHHGREALIGMLNFIHDGVTEILDPQLVVREDDLILAEVNGTFTADRDRPDFMFKPLEAGERLTMKFFTSYRLRNDQIAHFTLGCWPAQRQVT